MDVIDKFSGEVIGHVPDSSREDVARATARGRKAFASYSETPAWRRAGILRRAAELLEERQEELATLICREAGKAWKYSTIEVQRAVETFSFAAEEARRIHGETVPYGGNRMSGVGREGVRFAVEERECASPSRR